MSDEEVSRMGEILQRIGLHQYVSEFLKEMIEPNTVVYLSDSEWSHLGVNNIGDRVRIRQACRQTEVSSVATAVVERQSKRKRPTIAKPVKTTRRVHLGWKLCYMPSTTFLQQSISMGGGTHSEDMGKNLSLGDVLDSVKQLFFPGGVAPIQQLKIENASQVFMATFQGRQISSDEFPLEKYVKNSSSPVRLYLHTVFSSDQRLNRSLPMSSTPVMAPCPTTATTHPATATTHPATATTHPTTATTCPTTATTHPATATTHPTTATTYPTTATTYPTTATTCPTTATTCPTTATTHPTSATTCPTTATTYPATTTTHPTTTTTYPTTATTCPTTATTYPATATTHPTTATTCLTTTTTHPTTAITYPATATTHPTTATTYPTTATTYPTTATTCPTTATTYPTTATTCPTTATTATTCPTTATTHPTTAATCPTTTTTHPTTAITCPTTAATCLTTATTCPTTDDPYPTTVNQSSSSIRITETTSASATSVSADNMTLVSQSCVSNSPTDFMYLMSGEHDQYDEAHNTTESVLLNLKLQLEVEDWNKNLMNVSRYNVLDGAERCFKKPTFNPKAGLSVRFVGERGIDTGGLSRELMTLLTKAIRDSAIFQGEEKSKFLAANVGAANAGQYKLYGRMLAYMLCHDGPAPKFFSKNLFSLVVKGIDQYEPQLNDTDPSLRVSIQKICDASSKDQFLACLTQDVESVAVYIGAASLLTFEKKDILVKTVIEHSVKRNLRAAYEEFEDGLTTLGVLQAIRAKPHATEILFVHGDEKLMLEDLTFEVQYSPEGSNRYIAEIATHAMWLDYLEEISGKDQLDRVLAFITGMDEIPPLGFEPPLTLAFIHPDEVDESERGVPFANTCANTLYIPVGVDYEKMTEVMNTVFFDIGCLFVDE